MSKRNLTTSIIGDAGAAEATVVPNLESLNTGADAYVTSVSDTSEFNVFQQLKIYDNYWETLFARHIVNAANAGAPVAGVLSQVNIQGNTEGWCRADHICLQVPVEFQYNWAYIRQSNAEVIPNAYLGAGGNPQNAWDENYPNAVGITAFPWTEIPGLLNNPAIIFNRDVLQTFAHAWVGVLDVFNRIRLLIGNNGQTLQKQIEQEPIGLKHHMSSTRVGSIFDQVNSEWGIQNSKGYYYFCGDISSYPTANNGATFNPAATAVVSNTNNTFYNAMKTFNQLDDTNAKHYFNMLSQVDSVSNYDTRALLGQDLPGWTNGRRPIQVTRTRFLTLPLQSIMPLFRGAKYLPPDFRFKFEIETNSGVVIAKKLPMYVTAQGAANGIRDPCSGYSEIIAVCRPGQIELHYPYHILRQPVQAAISAMWLQKPFLFNFEAIQTTEIIPTIGTTYINFAISISTQRPTALDIYLFPIQSDTTWSTSGEPISIQNASDPAGLGTSRPLRILNTPHLYGSNNTINANRNQSANGPVVWENFEILFSGRTAYRFQNNQLATHEKGVDYMSTNDLFMKLFEEQSYRSTSTEYNASCNMERNLRDRPYMHNHKDCNKLLRAIIQPGGWTDRGVISSRQGATTITLNINFKRQLSNLDRFLVIRTNPEQLVFDSDKNITIIQWPAIKSNAGYLIPNVTAAP